MAAIPDYASGATEHWGLITYRESNLVLDPKQSSFANRVRVADVIAHELAHQVSWPPTQFYSVGIFCKNKSWICQKGKKSLICLEGKSITPHHGNTILFRSSQQLPRLRLGPLKGFFDLTRRPSRALNSPCALLLELQRNKDTVSVMCVTLGAEMQGHRSKQLMQAYDHVFGNHTYGP